MDVVMAYRVVDLIGLRGVYIGAGCSLLALGFAVFIPLFYSKKNH